MINAENSIVNLRERLMEADRRKAQQTQSGKSSPASDTSTGKGQKQSIADIIEIRNENKLAVSGPLRSEAEARNLVSMLKEKFVSDSREAISIHRKTNVNAVMGFYPFE